MRNVTEDIIRRAINKGRAKGRTITIGKSAHGKGVPVDTLNPDTPEGRKSLDAYFARVSRHYTISGLGAPEEPNAVAWRTINLSVARRVLVGFLVTASFVMKGNSPQESALPLDGRPYREERRDHAARFGSTTSGPS